MDKSISVIVPIYNEVKGIEATIRELEEINRQTELQMEFILVNDGSTDGTEKTLENFKRDDFHVITHDRNKGYGASIKTGIQKSKYDQIVITDADRTYPNKRILDLIRIFTQEQCDMVVGARIGKNTKIPAIRKPAKWFINKLANYLTGIKIPDLNSGLRVMNKKVVQKFFRILPDGFSFTTTITLAMLTNGYKVEYLPIEYYKRSGKSKIRPIRDTLNYLQLIIRTIIYFDPLKVFLPVSLTISLIGLLMLIYRIFVAQVLVITITILFVTSFQILAIGMLADLIDKRIKD